MADELSEPMSQPVLLQQLLASDLASEVKADFQRSIDSGYSTAAATGSIIERFRNALASPQDGPVVLLALTILQLQENQLQPVFRDSAIDLIESGEAMKAYQSQDAATRKMQRDMLNRLAEILAGASVVAGD